MGAAVGDPEHRRQDAASIGVLLGERAGCVNGDPGPTPKHRHLCVCEDDTVSKSATTAVAIAYGTLKPP